MYFILYCIIYCYSRLSSGMIDVSTVYRIYENISFVKFCDKIHGILICYTNDCIRCFWKT